MSNVSVPVMVDNIAEGREEFDLMLNVPSSLSPAITAGSRDRATGVITDSTSKCVNIMLNKNTLGVKKVQGQSAIRSSIANRYVRPKTLISVEAKKLLIKNLFNYLNDIQ